MNVSSAPFPVELISQWFRLLGNPERLRMLLIIAEGDVCVCHLEAALGYRQAYISQQLMQLRDAGLVVPRREGKHVFYNLSDHRLLELIRQVGRMAGYDEPEDDLPAALTILPGCTCPRCCPSSAGEEFEQESHGTSSK
jgi:ArsR family transcriptional regulator